jgi:hypothetical protein
MPIGSTGAHTKGIEMTNQSETTVRELSLDDLDRVSGAKRAHLYAGKHPDGDASLADLPPGPY